MGPNTQPTPGGLGGTPGKGNPFGAVGSPGVPGMPGMMPPGPSQFGGGMNPPMAAEPFSPQQMNMMGQ